MDQNGKQKPPSLNAIRMIRLQDETKTRNIRQLFNERGQLEEALEANWNELLHIGYNPPIAPKTHFTLAEAKEAFEKDGNTICNTDLFKKINQSLDISEVAVKNLESELSYQIQLNKRIDEVNKKLKAKLKSSYVISIPKKGSKKKK